jgi:hypothetical protein
MVLIKMVLNQIELRIGVLGLGAGRYSCFDPETTLKQVWKKLDLSLDDWKTIRFWKDWRNISDESCGNWLHPKSTQYPETVLLLCNYHLDSTLDELIQKIYENYGKPITNHTQSIITPVEN